MNPSNNLPSPAEKRGANEELSFDVTGLILDYLSHWKWFVLSVVVTLGAAWISIKRTMPVYEVEAHVFLNNDEESARSNAVFKNIAMPSYADPLDESQLLLMKSRDNLVGIVDSLDLAYSYYRKGVFSDLPAYGINTVVARMDSVDLHNLTAPISLEIGKPDKQGRYDIKATTFGGGKKFETSGEYSLPCSIETPQGPVAVAASPTTSRASFTTIVKIENPLTVASRLSGALYIGFSPNASSILEMSLKTHVIDEGKHVLREIVNVYNRDVIRDKNLASVQTEEFILDRLVMIASELSDVETRLENYRRANNIPMTVSEQAALYTTKANATEELMAQTDVEMQLLNDITGIISRQDDYSVIPQVSSDPELGPQIEAYNKRVMQLQKTLETVTPDNPLVHNMHDDLLRQKSSLLLTAKAARNNLNTRRRDLAGRNAANAGKLASVPTIDKGLQEIFREQEVKVNIYTYLLQKREEIALQKTMATPTARLIDAPVGSGPISPQPLRSYGIALVIGLLIPGLVILCRRLMFPTFKDKEDLARATFIPIIGEIAHRHRPRHASSSRHDPNDFIAVKKNDDSQISELFRLLRNNIDMSLAVNNKKIILVTSTVAGEGKTFFTANLAATFALASKRTLIIGADIRRPVIAKQLGLSNSVGLTSWLIGKVDNIDDIIFPIEGCENLFAIPAGPIPPNPNELLMSGRMQEIVKLASEKFDYIIIDTAPIGIVSDTLLLTSLSDIQIFVTRACYTRRNCLKVLHQEVRSGRLHSCYLVLNDVNMSSGSYNYRHYGHYATYSRGTYAYSSYRDQNHKSKKHQR